MSLRNPSFFSRFSRSRGRTLPALHRRRSRWEPDPESRQRGGQEVRGHRYPREQRQRDFSDQHPGHPDEEVRFDAPRQHQGNLSRVRIRSHPKKNRQLSNTIVLDRNCACRTWRSERIRTFWTWALLWTWTPFGSKITSPTPWPSTECPCASSVWPRSSDRTVSQSTASGPKPVSKRDSISLLTLRLTIVFQFRYHNGCHGHAR